MWKAPYQVMIETNLQIIECQLYLREMYVPKPSAKQYSLQTIAQPNEALFVLAICSIISDNIYVCVKI